jgi:hypothetical protein
MFELGSVAVLIWGMLFGAIGFGYFLYGKKQKAIIPLCVGIILCVFPYFIDNLYVLVGLGVTLIVIPYFVRV